METGLSLKVSRILHAGYVFECQATQIAFDPIFENPFSRNCYAFPNVRFDLEQIRKLKLSAIFISHYHDDHCSLESLNLLDRETPIYIYCLHEEIFSLIRDLGFKKVFPLKIDEPVKVGSFEVVPRRALESEVDSMFHIKAAGLNVLNVVDSLIDEAELSKLAKEKWDLILWPFQTMLETDVLAPRWAVPASDEWPEEWIHQLQKLNPKYIVPSSCQFVQENWSWYNRALFPMTYKGFQRQVEQLLPQAKVVRLNPSTAVVLTKDSLKATTPLAWIHPVGSQDIDYSYDRNLIPPMTSEIAKNFGPLTAEQILKVQTYCEESLPEKFETLEFSQDAYFRTPRRWQLAIYDHEGRATRFNYLLRKGKMELIESTYGAEEPLGWLTELPAAKLYAALEAGESLTSMYVRINDMDFAPEIENELKDVDVLEDPLVRCLFDGVFGSYQMAQLKKIKEAAEPK